jgi:hypothetical protein
MELRGRERDRHAARRAGQRERRQADREPGGRRDPARQRAHPGHRYLITGWVEVSLGKIYIGAADNNANLTHQVAAGGSEPSGWHYVSVVYTAGTGTAQVYCVQKTGNGFCANMSFRAMR